MGGFVPSAAFISIIIFASTAHAGRCPLFCGKDGEPVCGHSPTHGYKSFDDKCELVQLTHCGKEDWNLIHSGKCTPSETGVCPLHFSPVCGRSKKHGYKSFLNKCYYTVAAEIDNDYEFIHDGECTTSEVPPDVCPGVCLQVYSPICGYSPSGGFHSFSNDCYLTIANKCFFRDYSMTHTGECTEEELESNCKRSCTKDYRPVCGLSANKGYKNFSNLCVFYLENGCPNYDSDYKLIHAGACTTEEIASFCQPGFCSNTLNPVCASSLPYYRTFPNKCLYYVQNSCKYGDWQLVHVGECTGKEIDDSCNAVCSKDVVPVCGFSSKRGYKTFTNKCYVEYKNACYGSDYDTVHLGECKPEELGLICSREFCQQNSGGEVCGVSHTRGYRSFPNECYMYAENTCKYGDYKLAHVGECTKEERGMICVPEYCLKPSPPVCGYCPVTGHYTFPNHCSLTAENTCNKKDFSLVHEGKCTDHEVGGKCPLICSQDCQYLCAFSNTLGYKTFLNKCAFEAENGCNGGDYVIKHQGECTKSELEKNCQLQCLYKYKPVCALSPTKGYKTFPNKCSYILDITCYGGDYKFQYGGECVIPEETTTPVPSCQQSRCPAGYSPVCAFKQSDKSFKTFSTKCQFEESNECIHGYDYIFAHYGACTKDELENNCQRSCGTDLAPVCGLSPTRGYKSFKTVCHLILDIGCWRGDFILVHEGKCSAQEVPTCASSCLAQFLPVCGFSPSKKEFKTFPNKCKWEYENQCNYGDYILAHEGGCRKYEFENDCKRTCTTTQNPVCCISSSKGYKTFHHVCSYILDVTCSNGDYLITNEGKCTYPEGPLKDCPKSCPHQENPVCTFSSNSKSFKTFPNECAWEMENRCKYGDYVFVHPGKCTKHESGKKCYRKCPLIYKPVCGVHVTDGYRTFPSQCELEVANKCDYADYSLAHEGKCTSKELGGSCNHNCPLYYVGVCGFSTVKGYKTFASTCFLDRENTCTLSDYTVAHNGKCTSTETGKKCNRVCQLIYSPICGKCASKGYKTFANFCLLDRENSCFNQEFNVVHQGECFPWELCVNCSDD